MVPHSREGSPGFGPVDNSKSSHVRWKTMEFKSVSFNEGFWTKKLHVNRETSLRFGLRCSKSLVILITCVLLRD
jgi:hypothetical protein